MNPLLHVKNISKVISGKILYQELSFNFENGCYAIMGKNGVGKTILLEMLSGIIAPNSGGIFLNNQLKSTSTEYKKQMVYVPSNTLFFPMATGYEFLNFIISTKQPSMIQNMRLDETIKQLKLTTLLATPFKHMSLGTQKKLFLATLAIGKNTLIILDEPTNGLDEDSHHVLCEILRDLSASAILIVATHDLMLIKKISPRIITLENSPTQYFNVSYL